MLIAQHFYFVVLWLLMICIYVTGKLKEMGNSILGRFGMSVDNFKTVKDPNTGSYSVQFQK